MLAGNTFADVVGTTQYRGSIYYVDVDVRGQTAGIWLRADRDACGPRDILAATLAIQALDQRSGMQMVCRGKAVYNDVKYFAGCAASVGTAICMTGGAASTAASGGLAAPVVVAACSASVTYAANGGLADCIEGVAGSVAEYIGRRSEFNQVKFAAKISRPDLVGIVSVALDVACEDVKNPKR